MAVDHQVAVDAIPLWIAEDTERQFGTARPHQPGEAHDFAALDVETVLLEDLAVDSRVEDVPIVDLEDHFFRPLMGAGRVDVVDLAADHVPDHGLFRYFALRRVQGDYRLAVADDRDGVGDLLSLIHI